MPGSEFIKVTARVRPSTSSGPESCIVNVLDRRNLSVTTGNPRNFSFDAVFNKDATQSTDVLKGFNGTIFAYGQTGSGKTHTMLGPSKMQNVFLNCEYRGLIPRACDALFTKLCTRAAEKGESYKYEVTCKFVELYNEELYDLLSTSQQKLTIRSDSKVVQLVGVSEHPAYSSSDLMRILEMGWEARRTAETAMNRESSRSHAMFIIDSLTVLGRVIRKLSAAKRRDEHAPYRDSKLTHILRDSLGGNSKTAVIVNVHPDVEYCSETLSTLQFAAACGKIENRVHANEDLSGDTVMAYKDEITRLREELKAIEERIRSGTFLYAGAFPEGFV
ncbi:kinesin motor domain protein [Cooperia oncophora]